MAKHDIGDAAGDETLWFRTFIDFGEMALSVETLDDLLDTAAANVAAGLGADHAKILKRTGSEDLLVVAGVGWQDGVVGKAVLSGSTESPAGFALQSGRPVRSNDFSGESRFRIPALLREHGIKSAINVLIRGDDGPFGVLEVDSTEAREFSDRDTAFLQGYAQLLSSAILRVKRTEELRVKSEENAVLLNELHHRIGNDFQLVTSLIGLRLSRAEGEEAKAELTWISNRIHALSQLHEQLRRNKSSSHVDLGEYIASLCDDLAAVHSLAQRSVDLDLSIDAWQVDARAAVSIGLIVNEFIANSLEHAFPDGGGLISVTLSRTDDAATLTLRDSGPGFEMPANSGRSGLGLMHQLAGSVAASVHSEPADGGRIELRLRPRGD